MIDRYNESPVGCIEDEYGEYVKHSDYAALELDKLELEQERDQLKQVNAKLEADNQKLRDAYSWKPIDQLDYDADYMADVLFGAWVNGVWLTDQDPTTINATHFFVPPQQALESE